MMIEKRHIHRIEKIFDMLTLPLRLLDAQGACLVPQNMEPVTLPAGIPHGLNHRMGEWYLRALDISPVLYLAAPASAPGVEDVLCMADAMLMSLLKSSMALSGMTEVYRRILRQELTGTELISRAGEHQIPLDMARCVMIFQLGQTERRLLTRCLANWCRFPMATCWWK